MEFNHGTEKKPAPTLTVEEEQPLSAVGPFSQVKGIIARSETLSHDRYGDAIGRNKNAIWVIDASAPHDQHLHLSETDMVSDLQDRLSNVFDGSPLTPNRLLDALNAVLTTNDRNLWSGQVEFGLSIGGVYCLTDKIIVFNIGTGALYINNKMKIHPQKEFHNPHPMPDSEVVKKLFPTVKELPLAEVRSITICTDGVDLRHYSPTSNGPITKFIAPDAKEATSLRLER